MSNGGFNGAAFETAASRHDGKPIIITVIGAIMDDDGNVTAKSVDLRVNPLLDIVQVGAMAGALVTFGEKLRAIGARSDAAEAVNEIAGEPTEGPDIGRLLEHVAVLQGELPRMRALVRDCLIPKSRLEFDEIVDSIDSVLLAQIATQISRRLSGLDPTPPVSSPDGSETTGEPSTVGAAPAA